MDDMVMHHGTPWFDSPVTLNGDRTYKCKFNETWQCDYQTGYWRFWYEADHRYALPTVAFFTTAILIFTLAYLFLEIVPTRLSRSRAFRRVGAPLRWLSYRSWRIHALNWNTAPLGVLLLGAAGAIFFLAMTLGPQPYYWPNYDGSEPSYGNSMPIATRSGWMATGCLPFVILMAGKSNLVTMVTGVSHERLQPFHRWISYAMFILALIHTFPFIVYHIRIGDMVEKWNTQLFYWTGVVALIAQAYLTFASMGPLRNMGYEWFKFSHFLAALIFTLFFFFHCDFTLTSAQYFVVTVVFFAASWLHRQLRIYVEHGIGHRATISVAANGFVRVSVPTKARWRAGQHFFVRFMGLHVWATHPFSACSLPARASFNISVESKLVFYIRPQKGFTARLARYAETHLESQTRVLLDGPYGGVDMQKIVSCQRSVVIAGGSGAGWVLPLVIAFLRNLQLQSIENPQRPSLRVILVTRDKATQTWFEKAVADEIAACPVDSLTAADYSIELYYTGTTEDEQYPRLTGQLQKNFDDPEKAPVIEGVPKSELESSSRSSRSDVLAKPINVRRHDGRPDLSAIIAQEGDAQRVDSALGVFVCGPASMQSGATNAVAREQLRIMKDGSREMYFHCEHFSWA